MSEDKYRLFKAILATIFAAGILFIGYRFAENGRYQQADFNKAVGEASTGLPSYFDTRTGERQ